MNVGWEEVIPVAKKTPNVHLPLSQVINYNAIKFYFQKSLDFKGFKFVLVLPMSKNMTVCKENPLKKMLWTEKLPSPCQQQLTKRHKFQFDQFPGFSSTWSDAQY